MNELDNFFCLLKILLHNSRNVDFIRILLTSPICFLIVNISKKYYSNNFFYSFSLPILDWLHNNKDRQCVYIVYCLLCRGRSQMMMGHHRHNWALMTLITIITRTCVNGYQYNNHPNTVAFWSAIHSRFYSQIKHVHSCLLLCNVGTNKNRQ